MSVTESISQKLFTALDAYVHSVNYAKNKVNPEEWETHIDWTALERNAKAAMEEYAAGPQHEDERRWVMRIAVVSNDHLSEATFASFLEDNVDDEHQGAAIFRCDESFIVRVIDADEDAPESYPPDLVEALTWAREHGYTHVRFDPNGDFVSGLTDFEW